MCGRLGFLVKPKIIKLILAHSVKHKGKYYLTRSQNNSFIVWHRRHQVFHDNKLPCICSVYDIGFKVLSIKINYLSSFKHKHKHHKLVMEIIYLTSLNGIGVMTFSMKISYLASLQCTT